MCWLCHVCCTRRVLGSETGMSGRQYDVRCSSETTLKVMMEPSELCCSVLSLSGCMSCQCCVVIRDGI